MIEDKKNYKEKSIHKQDIKVQFKKGDPYNVLFRFFNNFPS